MRFFLKLSFKFFLLTSSLLFLSSCYSLPPANEAFEKKYGKEMEKVKAARTPAKGAEKEVVTTYPPSAAELLQVQREAELQQNYYPYVDVTQFGDRLPQDYFPNGETYEQAKRNPSNNLPNDMFEITYNTALYPAFRKVGVEFDAINIPPSDIYGVKTEMASKGYLLVGNDSLQKNIDKINSEKTVDDVEISEILIKEQKQLKRKEKMIKIFGQNSLELASLEKSKSNLEKNSDIKKEDKKESSSDQKSSDGQTAQSIEPTPKIVKN